MDFDNKNYFVTVDYFPNFFEIDRLEQATTKHVTKKLKAHFARYGIPETVVTDNGAQFISNDFNTFSTKYGFEHARSTPHHHQSNGKAESAVKQAKKMMRKCKDSGDDPYLALLTLRNTPQQHHETSPAQRNVSKKQKRYRENTMIEVARTLTR
jgi:transposase InsO family protein